MLCCSELACPPHALSSSLVVPMLDSCALDQLTGHVSRSTRSWMRSCKSTLRTTWLRWAGC